MKKALVFLSVFMSVTLVHAQIRTKKDHFFAKKLEVGTSVAYIFDNGDLTGNYRYDELAWNVNAKVSLTEKLFVGVQLIPLTTRIRNLGTVEQENYIFFGMLTSYTLYTSRTLLLHAEVSLNRSNMLNTRFSDPVQMAGIYYLGYGGGAEFLLNGKRKKNLFLELGFFNYSILNDIDGKSNFTQYVIGLNYHFGKL